MDPISLTLLAVSAACALSALGLSQRAWALELRRRREAWDAAAAHSGLSGLLRSKTALEGRKDGLRVRLEPFTSTEVSGTRISIWGQGLPADLTVKRGTPRQKDVEIGELAFDDAVLVRGEPALARALLDAETRRLLDALTHCRLERPGRAPFWADGRLVRGYLLTDVADLATWRGTGAQRDANGEYVFGRPDGFDYFGGSQRLPEVLQLLLSLAARLRPPRDVGQRLADNLAREPEGRARLLLLNTLLEQFPDHPATRASLHAALADPDARLRLRAGRLLGPEGRAVLLALARGEGAADEENAEAVKALGDEVDLEELLAILKDALRLRKTATARVTMGALARVGGVAAVPPLAKVLAVENGRLAAAAAEALGATRDAAAEEPLLEALASAAPQVKLAAARALGQAGTGAAVAALKEAEAEGGALRREAHQAVAEIQARLTGASPGQLSLAGGESGQLSLAGEDPAGRLSLAKRTAPGSGE